MKAYKASSPPPSFNTGDIGNINTPVLFDIFEGTPFFSPGVIINWAYKGIVFDSLKYNINTVTIHISVPEKSFNISGEKLASDFKEYISSVIKDGFKVDTMIMCSVRKGEKWNGI